MKALFFVTGIGYGDAVREYAIINKLLEKEKGTEVLIAAYDKSYKYFKNKFNTVEIKSFHLPETSFELKLINLLRYNILLPFFWLYYLIKSLIIVRRFKPDLIVTDFEPVGAILAKLTRRKLIIIFGTDPQDLNEFLDEQRTKFFSLQAHYLLWMYRYEKKASTIIIPSLIGKNTREGKFQFVNPIIRTQPEQLPSEKELIKKLNLRRKPILIMLGGSKFGVSIAHELIHIFDDFDEDFIIFGYDYLYKKENLTSVMFKENFLEYLKVCKGIITLAGHSTLSEALVYKKPCLVLPIKNHLEQNINAKLLEKNELALVKYPKEVSQEELKKHLQEFLQKINKMQDKLNKSDLQGNGAEQAADIILKV